MTVLTEIPRQVAADREKGRDFRAAGRVRDSDVLRRPREMNRCKETEERNAHKLWD